MSAPFDLVNLDHVVIRVSDMETMLTFYRDGLGCRVVRRRDEIGLIQLAAGASMIDLLQVGAKLDSASEAPAPDAPNMDHYCISIDPFVEDDLRPHLEAWNASPGAVSTRFGAGGMAPSLTCVDPEGNNVELRAARHF